MSSQVMMHRRLLQGRLPGITADYKCCVPGRSFTPAACLAFMSCSVFIDGSQDLVPPWSHEISLGRDLCALQACR